MAVVNILALCMFVLVLSLRWKERIVDVWPMAACILILVLYVLAFWRHLSWIDWIGGAFVLAVCAAFWRRGEEQRRYILEEVKKELSHPGAWAAVILFLGTAVLVNGRIATWWDDINFWATDVKALYALDGFAGKYANAASEFGDYPPGAQLMKWWFVHMRTDSFSEGLMFTGYYFCVFVFLLPLLRRVKSKNPAVLLSAAICLWGFPSVAEAFYCQGMCADLVMAVIYGAFLSAVLDEKGHEKSFYYLRLALYLSVLVLIKSVGFLWAAFGLVFLWIYKLYREKGAWRPLTAVTAAAALSGGSWLVFCLIMRRVAKLTGSALSIAAGNMPLFLPGVRSQLVRAFLEAFAVWPLHRGKTWGIDLSPLAMFVLICVLIALLGRRRILVKAEALLLGIFLPVSGLVFYGINLVSHLTIFAAESQYLEPFAMVSSIERYGAPFTIGSLYLLASVLLERWKNAEADSSRDSGRGRLWQSCSAGLLCCAFVLLTANWPEVWQAVYGYRAELDAERETREEMITRESADFLEMLNGLEAGDGMRILYLRDAAENQWVKNSYVAFEASPFSLMFGSVNHETMNSGDVWNAVTASHAGYLYADELPEEALELFAPFAEEFRSCTLYRIGNENGEIRLEEAAAVRSGDFVLAD